MKKDIEELKRRVTALEGNVTNAAKLMGKKSRQNPTDAQRAASAANAAKAREARRKKPNPNRETK